MYVKEMQPNLVLNSSFYFLLHPLALVWIGGKKGEGRFFPMFWREFHNGMQGEGRVYVTLLSPPIPPFSLHPNLGCREGEGNTLLNIFIYTYYLNIYR